MAEARLGLYSIPPHRAFADALAGAHQAVRGRADGAGAGTVVLPTNRAKRALTEAFVRASGAGLLLPRLVAVGDDLGEAAGAFFDSADDLAPVPPAVAPLQRRMILARLVAEAQRLDAAEAIRLAGDLGRTLDQLLIEDVAPSALNAIDAGDLNDHWQRALATFRVVLDRWPGELERLGRIDLATRRSRLLERVAEGWRATPPPSFVCAAGITSASPAIAKLLRSISAVPKGMVVLPGLDLAMDDEEWTAIGPFDPDPVTGFRRRAVETHPQFHLKLLIDRMGVGRGEFRQWRVATEIDAPPARSRAIATALAPAALTHRWTDLKAVERNLSGVRALEVATPADEAQAIALALREVLEAPGRTAALVTPDRALARRVVAHCARWGIAIDDSAGQPLSAMPPGTLLLALAEAGAHRFAPLALLALLKHPLVRAGEGRAAWLEGVRALDLALRGPRPAAGLAGIDAHLAHQGGRDGHLRRVAAAWWVDARPKLEGLENAFARGLQPLGELLGCLREAMTGLGGEAAWGRVDGRAAAELLAELEAEAPAGPARADPATLGALLSTLMDEVSVRPQQGGHPRLAIYGLLEARLQAADLLILGGLNEGVWPGQPAPDPWLAPRIRSELGLPGLERRVGLAAHDFAMGLGAREVLITRARRDASSPTIASRFWLRLQALAGDGLSGAEPLGAWARAMDDPGDYAPEKQPKPSPPVEIRPRQISVTEVDRLKADPFAFYARRMLRLAPLDPVDADPSAAWRGTAVHEILRAWAVEDDLDPDRLEARALAMLGDERTHPLMRALWQPRLMAGVTWIAAQMVKRIGEGHRLLAVERTGRAEIAGVELRGTFDRVDRLPGGGLGIIDYKTGKAPTTASVAAGYSLQLGLLGMIAERGGFEGVSGRAEAFEYWSLAKHGDDFGGITSPVDPAGRGRKIVTSEFVDIAERNFAAAAGRWLTGSEPFTAKLVPEYAPYAEYDQLMRLGNGMAASSATLPPLKGNQRAASDPTAHVWLSASAGTGKTQVLAARVYRLLLRGVDPGAILCLTFTKAGAAEMAGRIGDRLARWVRMPGPELENDLRALGEDTGPDTRERARRLFASVLDAPGGGLRIQTIHSFCQGLLAAFPVEAGLTPGFRPLEGREEAILHREALAEMLLAEEREGRTRIIDAIGALSVRLGEGGAESYLRDCASAPEAMAALPTGLQPFLRRALKLPDGDMDALVAQWCDDDAFDCAALRRLGDASGGWATKAGQLRAATIAAWLEADLVTRGAMLRDLHSVWAKADGEIRSFGKGQAPQVDGYADDAVALYDSTAALLGFVQRAAHADLLAGALDAGRTYAAAYAAAKRRIGAVDFDDLITRTADLLGQPGMGDWVRYKLDQATDHVLIDEAQDTNPKQWAIVRAIADEFFVGDGARAGVQRTLFTVGDHKQAIFSFQGSDPIHFSAMQRYFHQRGQVAPEYDTAARPLDTMSLTHSFRSTRAILEFVDAAIDVLPASGMGDLDDIEPHASEVPGPGTVTLWQVTTDEAPDDSDESWIGDEMRTLARQIARAVKGWIGTLPLESKGRMLAPEDVMILVKRRGDLASLIVARLYAEGVPVAGIDRLRLNAPLAVQDLLAAVRFVLQPADDLSLASLLVSPLIGWTQDELMVAAIRERGSLWRHLRATQDEARLAPLRQLLNRADFTTPYRFLEDMLSGELDGRRKLLLRLGEEARDPIEELLNAALTFESGSAPSLQRFLDWFDRGEVDIKRESSTPHGAVRVMTAHGAKGLQAPLVILADATLDPSNAPRRTLKWVPEGLDDPVPVFRPRAGEAVGGPLEDVIAQADAKELEEHWRLFYVAATRAEERLVVAGALAPRLKGVPPPTSWYAATAAAFDALEAAPGAGERHFTGIVAQPVVAAKPVVRVEAAAVDLPDWARMAAPEEARPPRPLAPSAIGDDVVADPPPTPAMRAAAERGRRLHALFERLPSVPAERRSEAADRWLAGAEGVADPAIRAEIVEAACHIISDPRFADVFGPDSLAEAPIAATVGGAVVAGTVDRLVVTEDMVRVVDFKTGRRAPASVSEIPPYHLRQMAAYTEALEVIFPGRRVEAALLYSAGPTLFALTDADLAPHKPRLIATEQSLPSRA